MYHISIYCKDVINIRLTRYISFRLEFCGVCHKHFGIFCLNKILNIDEMIIIFLHYNVPHTEVATLYAYKMLYFVFSNKRS